MSRVIRFAKSSIGAKLLMALSGLVLTGFVLFHMLGNLQIFLGQDTYNAYAAFLQGTPEILWPARLVLLSAVGVHIFSGVRLSYLNRLARPQAYHQKSFVRATFTSRTMILSGSVLLAFIIYHLLHFTIGATDPAHFHLLDAKGRHDAYSMFIYGFQNPMVAGFYIFAMLLLGMHLSHGVSSLFQTLGISHPHLDGLIAKIGPIYALIVVSGNILMPIAVLLGWLELPKGMI